MLLPGKITSMWAITFKRMVSGQQYKLLIVLVKYIRQLIDYFVFSLVFTIRFPARFIVFMPPPLAVHHDKHHIITHINFHRSRTALFGITFTLSRTILISMLLLTDDCFEPAHATILPVVIAGNHKAFRS